MTEALMVTGSVLGPPMVALAALLLRLRWQTARDQRRQDTLTVLASRLPEAGVIEIQDVRDDGSYLRMRLTARSESGQAS